MKPFSPFIVLLTLLATLAQGADPLPVSAPATQPSGLTTLFLYRGFRQGYIIHFLERPFDQRLTPQLDLAWGEKAGKLQDLYPDLKNPYFLNIRWIGALVPPASGPYIFRLLASPGARLMIDGKLHADFLYSRHSVPYDTPPLQLIVGQPVEIVLEHWSWVNGSVRLLWKTPDSDQFVPVPATAFQPASPATQPKAPAIPVPTLAPAPGNLPAPAFITLNPPPNTYLRYTLDGSEPTRLHGNLYTVPVAITATATLKVRAFSPVGGQSAVTEASYTLPRNQPVPGLKIFRTGNSLTVNALTFEPYILQHAGLQDAVFPIILAGNPTRLLWENFGGENVQDPQRNARKIVQANAPLDAYITQPFAENNLDREVQATGNFYDLVLAHSPQADLYIYMQWAEWRLPPDRAPAATQPAGWHKSMTAYVAWFEELRERLQAKYPRQRVRIIPVGIAFLNLQKAIDGGKIPGLHSFAYDILGDALHAGQKGCYFIGLVHYATLHRQNPAGIVVADTLLTPEQQKAFQEIAWDTVRQYPHSGFSDPPSTQPGIRP